MYIKFLFAFLQEYCEIKFHPIIFDHVLELEHPGEYLLFGVYAKIEEDDGAFRRDLTQLNTVSAFVVV